MLIALQWLQPVLLIVIAAAGAAAQGEMVVVKEGAAEFHRPGCPVVLDVTGVLAMTVAQAQSRGLKPHPACDPSKVPPPAAGDSRGRTSAKPAPVFVFVDSAGKHYHRERCARLGSGVKKIGIDAAAKNYWPCPVCRPPIRARKR
jgi:hypothetical protein